MAITRTKNCLMMMMKKMMMMLNNNIRPEKHYMVIGNFLGHPLRV